MYAKLFSRITESSIIEESITTRWVFVGLLAIADLDGTVIGTDIAIARRLNVLLEDFEASMKVLMAPDKESNNQDFEGRRIIPSQGERGYFLTGYQRYRSLKSEDERREYMRVYMNNKRHKDKELQENVNSVNSELAQLTHTEANTANKHKQEEEVFKDSINHLISIWNQKMDSKCLRVTTKRRVAIGQRLSDAFFCDNWIDSLDRVAASPFCGGQNERGWKADIDWFLKPDSVTKIMEGKYDKKSRSQSPTFELRPSIDQIMESQKGNGI